MVATSNPITIRDTSITPTPTYSISSSPSSTNEGDTVKTTVSTKNVAPGTTLYYSLSGSNINKADVSAGSLTGSCTTNKSDPVPSPIPSQPTQQQKATNPISNIKLYTSANRSNNSLVATSNPINIRDTSSSQATYSSLNLLHRGRVSPSAPPIQPLQGTKLFYAIEELVFQTTSRQ